MADIALSRDFLGAYARLPRKAQRKLDELLTKFRQDSTAASIHVEPIQRAADPLLRSARIGDDYRVILRAPERGDVYIALWADHHDEAYRWAANKQTAVHPATGTLQIFDVEEAARAVTVELTTAPPTAPADHLALSAGDVEDAPDLFAAHDDDTLFAAGVPRALLPSVRAIFSDEDLERLVPHLPPEAGEILTGLAAGLSLDEALEDVLGRPPAPVGASEPAPVDTADIKSALEREATQRQFFLLGDALDLDSALRHPLDAWRVFLHPKQRKLAQTRTKGPTRVTGGAGTGKTVVALHRTAFLVREVYPRPDDRVLLTTFTVNLAHDLRAQLTKLLGPDDLARVEVTPIDRWASEYLRRQGESFQLIVDKEQRTLLRQVHDVYGTDGLDLDFCIAEWREVIQDQDLRNEEAYVKAIRRHRGVPLSRAQRRLLWTVFAEYRQLLNDGKRLEPLDVIRRARTALESKNEPSRYRAVVVDETQDFSAEGLRLLRAIAGPEHPDDLFLVGDAHQRIYGRQTALSSCGISVRGRRSQTLRINYRTTAAISRFAFGALLGVEVDDLDDGKADRRGAVALRDGPEPVMRSFELPQEEEAAVVATVQAALQRGVPPEAIAVVARTRDLAEQRFGSAISDAGIDAVYIEQEEPRRAAVRLATLHRVKGLEFQVVIVAGASDAVLPYPSPELKSEDPIVRAQELLRERCLLYVATSRARDELYVFSYGTPSPLLSVVPRASRPAPPVAKPRSAPPVPALVTEERIKPAGATATVLDTPLGSLELPARMATFIWRKEIETLRDLAAIPPHDLLSERNLGRGSIADTRAIIEPLLGTTWEQYAEDRLSAEGRPSATPMSLSEAGHTGNWDLVRAVLTEPQLGTPLANIEFSARARTYVEREGLKTLHQLAARSRADLTAAENLGRGTVKDIASVVAEHFDRELRDRLLFDAGLLDGFKNLLQEFDQMDRIILSRRAGVSGTEATLEELGEIFGVTRERIRQIESRACESVALRVGWSEPTRAKLRDAVATGATNLAALARDPWWAAACNVPSVIEYVGESILGVDLKCFVRNESTWLSRWTRQQVERAAAEIRARLTALVLPCPKAEADRLVHETAGRLGPELERELTEEATGTLHVETRPDGTQLIVGVGQSQRTEVLAALRAASEPIRAEFLFAQLGGRMNFPDEVLNFDRGVVGLRQHFPDFDLWKARLVPASVALMKRLGPERQWSTAELVDELREEFALPVGFNAYWLGSLVRDTEQLRYLGRNRVALPGSENAESRIYIHEALERLLKQAGAPVARSTLLERLEAQLGASEITLSAVFARPQFVRLGEDRIGLRARDVPGGEPAIGEATDLLESVLLRRDTGLSSWQAHLEIQALSPSHEQWPRDLTLSLLRTDDRFRLNQAGSVGLASWEGTRVPTRLEMLRTALADSGGTVSVEALSARIEAHYGEPPTRATLASMANHLNASLDGEWLRVRG